MTLDEALNDAMDMVWDETVITVKLAMTNIKQAKKTLDDIGASATDAASKQLSVALDQLAELIEPLPEEDDEPEPRKKNVKKKVK